MIQNLSTQELIAASTLELLQENDISDITVGNIVNNCRLSQRAFYNHFRDKFDAMNWIYLREMESHILDSLYDWNERMSSFFQREFQYFFHALGYKGQNNLSETIIKLDKRKYAMHIKTAVILDSFLLSQTRQGINYMIYGNIGELNEFIYSKQPLLLKDYQDYFHGIWDLMRVWLPPVVLENLELLPVRDTDVL